MKPFFKMAAIGLLFAVATLLPMMMVSAQFPNQHPDGVKMPPLAVETEGRIGGPVAVGQQMLQADDVDHSTHVALIQSHPVVTGGGVIQLSAFGWLEPYVDSIVQTLLMAGIAWLMKSKYTQWMDQSARDALGTFAKNTANSLIADGFVHMQGKTVHVNDAALAREANDAATRIPDALKRFGITPDAVAAKIVDAIPQTAAGAQIVAAAHTDPAPASS
jgi:hypothetical protein